MAISNYNRRSKIYTCIKTQTRAIEYFESNMTMVQIADVLGVGVQPLHRFYKSKDMKLKARAKRIHQQVLNQMDPARKGGRNIELYDKIKRVIDSGKYDSAAHISAMLGASKSSVYRAADFYQLKIHNKTTGKTRKPRKTAGFTDYHAEMHKRQVMRKEAMAGLFSLKWLRKPISATASSGLHYHYPSANRTEALR